MCGWNDKYDAFQFPSLCICIFPASSMKYSSKSTRNIHTCHVQPYSLTFAPDLLKQRWHSPQTLIHCVFSGHPGNVIKSMSTKGCMLILFSLECIVAILRCAAWLVLFFLLSPKGDLILSGNICLFNSLHSILWVWFERCVISMLELLHKMWVKAA